MPARASCAYRRGFQAATTYHDMNLHNLEGLILSRTIHQLHLRSWEDFAVVVLAECILMEERRKKVLRIAYETAFGHTKVDPSVYCEPQCEEVYDAAL